MNRERRTRILVRGSASLRGRLAAAIEEAYSVEELADADEGLVMIKARETARGCLYYLGELLVTEAKVRVRGATGLGIIAGFDAEAARALAVIDAACNASLPEAVGWEALLLDEESAIAARDEEEAGRVARSRVEFESMDREIPS
jgi:alpha-D-ribose 1-methylphosphonate 5-triphosphate synthase subunit PhnG